MKLIRTERNEEGVALVLALMFLVLLTALIVSYMYETEVDASYTAATGDEFQCLLAARSAVAGGMALLEDDLTGGNAGGNSPGLGSTGSSGNSANYDGLDEVWCTQDINGDPTPAGQPVTMNGAMSKVSITDESGKINLNALVNEKGERNKDLCDALGNLLGNRLSSNSSSTRQTSNPVASGPELVDAIVEWEQETPGQTSSNSGYGGTGTLGYYESLPVPYSPKNGKFDSVEELLAVRGMTPEIFFGDPELAQPPLTDLLTVVGDENGSINVNTAWPDQNYDPEVLNAIDPVLGTDFANRVQQGPFTTQAELDNAMTTAKKDATFKPVIKSDYFRISGYGVMDRMVRRIDCYVYRDPNAQTQYFTVLKWRVFP